MPESGEKSTWGMFDARRKPHETTPINAKIVFIDQSSPFQPYVKNGELDKFWDFSGLSVMGMIPASDEGFYHNNDRQRFVGETLAKLFSFSDHGAELLEVGYGSNHFVAEGIARTARMPVCLLDFNNGLDEIHNHGSPHKPPQKIKPLSRDLLRYVGDMIDIDAPRSALKDRLFAGIFYNGSWVAGGNNWTVMQIMEAKYAQALGGQPDWNSPLYQQYKDQQLNNLLQTSKQHLSPNGVLFIGSSRYAYHGAGYEFDRLPDEKIEFLDVIRRLKNMGAKKITVIGVSSAELLRMYRRNLKNPEFKHIRTKRAFEGLFTANMFRNSPRFSLSDKNGMPIPDSELKQMASSPEQLDQILADSPTINDKVQKELGEQQSHGELILNQLMGGLESLTQLMQYSSITPDMINVVKKDLKGFIDPRIGRIDAVAAEF
jgi:hypothetical protein